MAIELDHGAERIPPTSFWIQPAAPPYAKTLPYAPSGPEPPGSFRLGVRLREKAIGQPAAAGWANHFGHGDITEQLSAESD